MKNLKQICEVLQANDRNSDIMDCYQEYLNGTMPKEVLQEIIDRELSHME